METISYSTNDICVDVGLSKMSEKGSPNQLRVEDGFKVEKTCSSRTSILKATNTS